MAFDALQHRPAFNPYPNQPVTKLKALSPKQASRQTPNCFAKKAFWSIRRHRDKASNLLNTAKHFFKVDESVSWVGVSNHMTGEGPFSLFGPDVRQ
jgi:hypothetical protein